MQFQELTFYSQAVLYYCPLQQNSHWSSIELPQIYYKSEKREILVK